MSLGHQVGARSKTFGWMIFWEEYSARTLEDESRWRPSELKLAVKNGLQWDVKNLKQREAVGMDVRSIREVSAVRLENKTYGYSRRSKPEHWRGCWCYEGRVLRWGVTSCHCSVIVPCLFTQINGPKSTFLSSWACCLQGLHEESTFSVSPKPRW